MSQPYQSLGVLNIIVYHCSKHKKLVHLSLALSQHYSALLVLRTGCQPCWGRYIFRPFSPPSLPQAHSGLTNSPSNAAPKSLTDQHSPTGPATGLLWIQWKFSAGLRAPPDRRDAPGPSARWFPPCCIASREGPTRPPPHRRNTVFAHPHPRTPYCNLDLMPCEAALAGWQLSLGPFPCRPAVPAGVC